MNYSWLVQWLKTWSWSQTARVGISAPPLTNCDLGQTLGFPRGASGKEPTASAGAAGDVGLTPGLGRSPGGGHGSPLQYSFLENPMDKSLVGYSSKGRKELNMTELLSKHTYFL